MQFMDSICRGRRVVVAAACSLAALACPFVSDASADEVGIYVQQDVSYEVGVESDWSGVPSDGSGGLEVVASDDRSGSYGTTSYEVVSYDSSTGISSVGNDYVTVLMADSFASSTLGSRSLILDPVIPLDGGDADDADDAEEESDANDDMSVDFDSLTVISEYTTGGKRLVRVVDQDGNTLCSAIFDADDEEPHDVGIDDSDPLGLFSGGGIRLMSDSGATGGSTTEGGAGVTSGGFTAWFWFDPLGLDGTGEPEQGWDETSARRMWRYMQGMLDFMTGVSAYGLDEVISEDTDNRIVWNAMNQALERARARSDSDEPKARIVALGGRFIKQDYGWYISRNGPGEPGYYAAAYGRNLTASDILDMIEFTDAFHVKADYWGYGYTFDDLFGIKRTSDGRITSLPLTPSGSMSWSESGGETITAQLNSAWDNYIDLTNPITFKNGVTIPAGVTNLTWKEYIGQASSVDSPYLYNFVAVAVADGEPQMSVTLSIVKKSSVSTYSPSLLGCEYTVYTDAACTVPASDVSGNSPVVITVDSDGVGTSDELPSGKTYYVKETKTNDYYLLSDEVRSVDTSGSAGDSIAVSTNDDPFVDKPKGADLSLVKTPSSSTAMSSPFVSNISSCPVNYPLSGAVYWVYTDSTCTSRAYVYDESAGKLTTTFATFTTDSDGNAGPIKLLPGTYWVKENTVGAKSWQIDAYAHDVTLSAGGSSAVTSYEPLVGDPPEFVKVDEDTGDIVLQGLAKIGGARFKISYYDVSGNAPSGSPKATCTIKVNDDVDGESITIRNTTIVSGMWPFLKNGVEGDYVLPQGVYVIEEIQAPEGYDLNNPSKWAFRLDVDMSRSADNGRFKYTLLNLPGFADWVTSNTFALALPNSTIDNFAKLSKSDADTGEMYQGDAELYTAQFQCRLSSDKGNNPIKIDARTIYPGELVDTFKWQTSLSSFNTLTLPYAYYTVSESVVPDGYQQNNEIKTLRVGPDGKTTTFSFTNNVLRFDLPVKKTDDWNGEPVKAKFSIINMSKHEVYWNGNIYSVGAVMDTSWTNDEGELTWYDLPYGTYKVTETAVQTGYNLDPTFKLAGEELECVGDSATVVLHSSLGNDKVIVEDPAIRGDVEVLKTNIYNEPLVGATYAVYVQTSPGLWCGARDRTPKYIYSGGEVLRITSGDDGIASTYDGALLYGSYKIVEVKAPVGYELDEKWYGTFSIDTDGQLVSFTEGETSYVQSGDNANTITAPSGKYAHNVNQTGYDMPVTGAAGVAAAITAGVATAVGSAAALFRRKKR